jgi:hypothetical protein
MLSYVFYQGYDFYRKFYEDWHVRYGLYWPWLFGYEPHTYREWEKLIHLREDFLREIVRPSHILVFPYPRYHLPNISFAGYHNIVANRLNRDPYALSAKDNATCAAKILIGLEQGSIREVRV